MNNFNSLLEVILLQWTTLLGLAWGVHWLSRRRHSRWRLILWRAMLCFVFLVPLAQLSPVVVFRVPGYHPAAPQVETPQPLPPEASHAPASSGQLLPPTPAKLVTPAAKIQPVHPVVLKPSVPWKTLLLISWDLGAALAVSRLVWLQSRLRRIKAEAIPAAPSLQNQVREIQGKLGVRQHIAVLVSSSISSSFVCGLLKPAILVPPRLLKSLPPDELSVLLAHEVAHFGRHDLFWCVAWRWMQAFFWFHPLVWKIPAAHNLACEQEADRIASGQVEDRDSYSQLLARLALRVLAMPQVETRLALNGTSQIAKRLIHLQKRQQSPWTWRHSLAGFTLVALLFFAVTGCRLSMENQPKSTAAAPVEFKTVLVVVQDQDGKAISGASIKPPGFRVKGIHAPDAYSWRINESGPAETATTDQEGRAYLKYPVMGIPEEKELTRSLILVVSNADYSSVHIQSFAVDGTDNPIRMTRGISVEVSGYFGAEHQPVTDLVPNLNQDTLHVMPEDWVKRANGTLTYHRLSAGGHLLQLMGRLPSGEIVFSDTVAFTAEPGKLSQFSLEMKPGIGLEGRLDDRVPRPVRNGRVMIDVRPKEYPALLVIEDFYDLDKQNGGREFWHSYRPIAEDGTFVFESLPPGEADIVVLGDGFATRNVGELQNRVSGGFKSSPGMTIPQPCPLVTPVTKVEIATEPTATLEFTATNKGGEPIEGVWFGMFPTAFRMRGMYGWSKISSEAPFRNVPQLPDLTFSGRTDKTGKVVLANIPARSRGIDVEHSRYQVPLQDPKGWRDRHVRAMFSPGQTNYLKLVMEPKGTDFIGAAR
jgi:beta-lactamase regulating signal transducer with metallopeptidase domain